MIGDSRFYDKFQIFDFRDCREENERCSQKACDANSSDAYKSDADRDEAESRDTYCSDTDKRDTDKCDAGNSDAGSSDTYKNDADKSCRSIGNRSRRIGGKKLTAAVITGVLVTTLGITAVASTPHYNNSSVTGAPADWASWVREWPSVSSDFTKVSITPGSDETELNFAWYTNADAGTATPSVQFGIDKSNLKEFKGSVQSVDTKLTDGHRYVSNHVTVTGLKANTSYHYRIQKNGVWGEDNNYSTGSFSSVKIMLVGDPQIGASKGQDQGGGKLESKDGVANTAARNDGFAWNRTLTTAQSQNPDIDFIISAGDQVNKTGKAKEEEYSAYLSPAVLSEIPVATTIGNHDSLNTDYSAHFFDPNQTGNGQTAAGGDYYYSYGPGLFVVLNMNNYNAAEHEDTIKKAIAAVPDAKWRVVTIHQDIYGSGADHSETDGMILRTQLTPIFDKYDIDVVLQGHDHTYSRSKVLYGDGQTHGTYEFQLAADGSDYDWYNAYNTQTGAKIPLAPEDTDASGTAANKIFKDDNHCYTLESGEASSVTDPQGTLYITANSASGSKYYELNSTKQDYIANRSQNWLPSYSIINMTASSFSIDTYQITDTGAVEPLDTTFTINK